MDRNRIIKKGDYLYEIPVTYKKGMLVPARIYASEELLGTMDDAVFDQITNVATLPGIVNYAMCMPDGHSGYGFPIGGVAAIDPEKGIISPGGIGFDINCGVRLAASSLTLDDIKPRLKDFVDAIFKRIPSGVGSGGILKLSGSDFDNAMVKGVAWAVEKGYALKSDMELTEEGGCVKGADPSAVSRKARERGAGQIGSLGSGNHYLEIEIAEKKNIFDSSTAAEFGINEENQVLFMIHSGSRGFGHQVATDYLGEFAGLQKRFGYNLPDRELACAPFNSPEGQRYFGAMNCAINIAFLNRQLILHGLREVINDFFGSKKGLYVNTVYDVCHNTAKLENHVVDGVKKKLLVHRKGATRAFPPGSRDIPGKYRKCGQPVLIGGSMERGSYLMAGTDSGADSFYSTVHGSGRVMSRHDAKKKYHGRTVQQDLSDKGIYVKTASYSGLAEEAGGAYKDIDEVVRVSEKGGLSRIIAKLIPIGNIKG